MDSLVFQLALLNSPKILQCLCGLQSQTTLSLISFETNSEVKMKIFILKLWYAICGIFCLYSLKAVVEERYDVAILAVNQSETDLIIFFVCKELSSFQLNKTEIRLEELRVQLVNYVNGSAVPQYLIRYKTLILNRLEIGQYMIFNGLICIISKVKDKYEGSYISSILSGPVIYFAFRNSTLDFFQMASFQDSFDEVIVQKRGPPYSNCNETNDKFRCLNECFKSNFRLSRYFYEGNETGLIHLKLGMNQTIEESEKRCLRECWRENCKILQIIPLSVYNYKTTETTTLGAEPKMSEFDFWVQFIGLVCSFANISLNQLTSLLIGFASSKVKRRKVRITLFCLKWAILFLSLIFCGYLYTTMFLGHKADERSPPTKKITRNFIKQKSVRLAICVDIKDYFQKYLTKRYGYGYGYDNDYDYDPYYLDINKLNKTMLEIEIATNSALDDHLEGIHLNYQEKMFKIHYILEPKVLFRGFRNFYSTELYRCFSLLIVPDYQLMPSNPKLTIKFKKENGLKLFLLTKNESLNEKTFEYSPEKAFKKRVVRRLKQPGRCVNYPEKKGHCTGKMNCIESCINREAFEKFRKIPIDNAVVDRDQFSPEEWKTIYPMEIPFGDLNHKTYKNISSRCLKKFQDEHCEEVNFNKKVEIVSDSKTKKIDLFIDVELSVEEFTWFKLFLSILNIQSIFFGMTVLKLLRMIYSFFKPMLIIRNDKIATFFIYLLCSIGFTWHTYRIFDLSIQGELAYSPNYEIIISRTQMPVIVFCLPVDEKLIDKNHQLTGNYLEQVTSDITPTSVFESILYLNESSEWVPFSPVERFFFMHLKCFNINIAHEYDRRQFHFSTNSHVLKVLKVNFTKKFINRKTVYFMSKTNETGFSNVVNLIYDKSSTKYLAEQSELKINYEDRFSLMKRLLSTSYEDDFSDLDGQLPGLNSGEFHFKTLKIPVEKKHFDFELRDDLFEQLFARLKTETTQRNSLISLDYQQTFVSNQFKQVSGFVSLYDSSFTFSLVLIKKTLWAKNEENFSKLVLNLLNVLFLWFDLGILDLHPIFILTHDYLLVYLYLHWPRYLFDKITQFLLFSHRWLKKFEQPLYKRLNSRKRSAPQTSQA